ncbi:MAG TPA: FkbM family methyltransferase [Pyrinomonadaceae bacterium]|jgi:FkbM family methyltransferase|nr:FkbM family methyltransferase [Pyrinomonadaceae bacterium]
MNFSGFSNQGLLGKILRQPLKLIPSQAAMPILQGPLRGKRWIAGSHTHGCWLGSYEGEKQRVLQERVRPGDTVYDIGANAGFYSLLSSELVGPQGHVFAFEPLPRNITFLNEHLRLNHVINVKVIAAAVSDKDGETFFDEGPGSAMGHMDAAGGLKVRTVSIDQLIAGGEILPPSVMKIDVEGAEFMVLSGGKNTLMSHHPVIFLATHGAAVHAQCCELLASLGFRVEEICGERADLCDELIAYCP